MAARKTLYRFTVVGQGRFPIDMLRYDHCWPDTQDDATKLNLATDRITIKLQPEHEMFRITLASSEAPPSNRWETFKWKVVEQKTVRL